MLPYDVVADEFDALAVCLNESLPAQMPKIVIEKWSEVRRAIFNALINDPQLTESRKVLLENGWAPVQRSENVLENKHVPGVKITISGNNFTITKGSTIIQPSTTLNKLESVLTSKKQDGTIPGSITNKL